MKNPISLDDLEIYQLAMEIGEITWIWVANWPWLAQKTVGDQIVRSSDSIAANIAEGYGRYFFKERKLFCYYSRGSLLETKTWAKKALQRQLVSEDEFNHLIEKLQNLHVKLNAYLRKLNPPPSNEE